MDLQPHRSPPRADWYVITDDGLSALRIRHGLRVGETDAGALVLNDPDPENCWLEFEFGDQPTPAIRLLRDQHVLVHDGERLTGPYPLSYGVVLQLPHNELHLGPDIGAARRPGLVLRIEPAPGPTTDVPEIRVPEPQAQAAEPAPAEASGMVGTARDEPASPSTAASQTLFVPSHRRREPATPAEVPVRPPARTAQAQPPRMHARRTRGGRARLVALLMVAIGVAVAVYQYPTGTRSDGSQVVTARLVTATDPAVPPPPVAIEAPRSEADDQPDINADAPTGPPVVTQANALVPPEDGIEPAPAANTNTDTEPVRPVTDTPPTAGQVADDGRLTRARQLLAEGHITYPPEANAVALALDLLLEQPGHAGAMAVLGEATNQLLNNAVQAHEQGQDFQARNTLEEVFGFNPDNPRARQLWREWMGRER